MSDEFPKRSANIIGVTAVARVQADRPKVKPQHIGPIDITPQFRMVKDAVDWDLENHNPGDSHHCPLCNEAFGWEAFKAHAPQCIEARAPRKRLWMPPGTKGALNAFQDTIKVPRGGT